MEISDNSGLLISCRNTRTMIQFLRIHYGEKIFEDIFYQVLEPKFLTSSLYYYKGKPLDIDFFCDVNNWFPYEIMQVIFRNLEKHDVNPIDLGRYSIGSLKQLNNVLVLAFIQVYGLEGTVKKVNKINSLYNKTKTVELIGLTDTGGVIQLQYADNATHSPYVTQYNVGVYLAVLEYMGLRNVTVEVTEDRLAGGGYTTIQFGWEKSSLWKKIKCFFGYVLSNAFCKEYLKTEHALNTFHNHVIESLHQEVAAKEKSQNESKEYFQVLLRERENREEALASLVESQTGKLRHALEEKEQFFENISHELKTPLTLIMGHAELLRKELEHDPCLRIRSIESNANLLQTLLDQLLRKKEFQVELPLEQTNLSEELTRMVEEFEPLSLQRKIKISLSISDEAKPLEPLLPTGSWKHIVSNLLSNALKFSPIEGEIQVIISYEGEAVNLNILDQGCGFTESEKTLYIQRYQRGNTQEAGQGLGFSIIEHYLSHCCGKLSISDNKPRGAIVSVTIPVNKARSQSVATTPIDETKGSGKHKYTILLVEDNLEMQSFLKVVLADSFNVDVSSNGLEALSWLEAGTPDLILSDVMMPGMNGFELCKKVKQEMALDYIPFILLSAKADLQSQKEGMRYSADDYISKPFSSDLLVSKLNNQLQTREALRAQLRLRVSAEHSTDIPTAKNKEEEFVDQLNRALAEYYSDNSLNIDKLAEELCTTSKTLARKTKSLLNSSPAQLLRKYRLGIAKVMLEKGYKSSEVAFNCGFSSQSYFSKCFKERYGVNPASVNVVDCI